MALLEILIYDKYTKRSFGGAILKEDSPERYEQKITELDIFISTTDFMNTFDSAPNFKAIIRIFMEQSTSH